jgi:hypothetical protein
MQNTYTKADIFVANVVYKQAAQLKTHQKLNFSNLNNLRTTK